MKRCNLLLVLSLVIVFFANTSCSQDHVKKTIVVNVADFGAIPNDGIDDREAIQAAINSCSENDLSELVIPSGVYDIIDNDAMKLMNDIMGWKMGANPEKVIFTPYFKYSKGIDFDGKKNITVKGSGATLLCHGWMEPVSIENCSDIKVEGITIDYKYYPHTEGKVIDVDKDYIDVRLTDNYWLRDNMLITRIMFWNLDKNRMSKTNLYFPSKSIKLDDNTLRVFIKANKELIGTVALMNHTSHFRPAILIQEAKNTVLKQVTIHSQPGMGIVGHRSENILVQGLRVVPRAGYYESSNTDATHFTSCEGTIRFEGCTFEGQGDDAINVKLNHL